MLITPCQAAKEKGITNVRVQLKGLGPGRAVCVVLYFIVLFNIPHSLR